MWKVYNLSICVAKVCMYTYIQLKAKVFSTKYGSDDEPCVSVLILVIGQEADNQNEFFTCYNYKEADDQLCLGSASEWVTNEII